MALAQKFEKEPQIQKASAGLRKKLASSKQRLFLKRCQQAVRHVKDQVELIEICEGLHEMLQISFLTFALTNEIFRAIFVTLKSKPIVQVKVVSTVKSLSIYFGRLFLKCYFAERISNEVK